MVQFFRKYAVLTFVLGTIITFLVACANMATPEGGEMDFDPPKVVKTSPAFNSTNITKGKIVIDFDENVTLERPSDNVIITPPQKSFPVIQSVNKRLTVELKDTLLENTTYTIDFTSSIKDNNEGNPLENFSFSFSTGDVIDSLVISGKVLNAENLEPVKGIYVGLHSNLNDTAFTKIRFERIGRTGESGDFAIRGVAPGTYRLYALDDPSREYMYINPSNTIAFFETLIEPSSARATRFDTIYVDTTKKVIDTIKTIEYTRFIPDNIVLRSFKSDFQRQYLQKHERVPNNKLSLLFGAPTEMPVMEPLNFDAGDDWYVLEKSRKNDTLTYWIKNPELIAMDTLAFRITYPRNDSLNQVVPYTDTLRFVDRTRKKSEKELKKEKEKREKDEREGKVPEINFLNINSNLSQVWDTYKDITLEFDEPIEGTLDSKIRLQQLNKDSVYADIPFELVADSLNGRKYLIRHKWVYKGEYKMQMDSASIHSIYGLWNNAFDQQFKVKADDEYGQLAIVVMGVDTIPSFIELLDKADKPIRKSRVKDNAAIFRDLNPGTYYARIILDENNNGIWDTGDFYKGLQPEMVCYYPGIFEIKAFWNIDNEANPWIIDISTLAKQKPLEITKQKPEEKESRRKKMEERDQKNRNRNRSSNIDESQMLGVPDRR